MTATLARTCTLGEIHRFQGGGRQFLYLPGSGAIFEMDDHVQAAFDLLSRGPASPEDLASKLVSGGMAWAEAVEVIDELIRVRVIVADDAVRETLEAPPADFPPAEPGDEPDQPVQSVVHLLL